MRCCNMDQVQFNPDTQQVTITLDQLAALLEARLKTIGAAVSTPEASPRQRYVYGLKGIMNLFKVSNMTAQRYKKTIIREAVSQNGRVIVVDADKALELFKERKGGELRQEYMRISRRQPLNPEIPKEVVPLPLFGGSAEEAESSFGELL